MEMVASSKMRKTQDRMEMGRPYANRMLSVIGHLANSNPEYKPVYMSERDVKGIGVIVIGSDKGLCGGLNINLFRTLLPFLKEQSEACWPPQAAYQIVSECGLLPITLTIAAQVVRNW